MGSTSLIAVKETDDSLETQLEKLGFLGYVVNKELVNEEHFYAPVFDSIRAYKCDGYSVFFHTYLDLDTQMTISKRLHDYKIVAMSHSDTANSYYICITEKGRVIRKRSGMYGGDEDDTIGDEFDEEKALYESTFKKNGITHYKFKQKSFQEPEEKIVEYTHDQVGATFCNVILNKYLGITNEGNSYGTGHAKEIKVFINKQRLDSHYSKIHLTSNQGLGKVIFLRDHYVIKSQFLPLILEPIHQKLSKRL